MHNRGKGGRGYRGPVRDGWISVDGEVVENSHSQCSKQSPTASPHDTTALILSPRTWTRKDKSIEARSRLVVVLELGRRRFEIQNKTTPIRRCHLGFKAGDSPLSRLLDSVKLNPFNESEIHRLEKKDGRKARQKKYPGRRKTKVKGKESRVLCVGVGRRGLFHKVGGRRKKNRKFNTVLA
ncbi:PREDICTED: uncharacterized protein LOC108758174 [Trachymyrmex cornetzi]|uniref:uncharacterized protein LOC108758174 n=1 Tax=Trachymyrmex cornetzi TaxID=471704 RepID=UPI00084F3D46|nr:PREDICTED: uncharacterized protein LOC108758174 [Trachymyrmex cornetzi]